MDESPTLEKYGWNKGRPSQNEISTSKESPDITFTTFVIFTTPWSPMTTLLPLKSVVDPPLSPSSERIVSFYTF